MNFECVTLFSKFTQNSLVLIQYWLNYSQQCFLSIKDENLRRWNYWRER